MTELITISYEYFEKLLDDQMMLEALERAGVDNWDGYDFALEHYEELKNDQ